MGFTLGCGTAEINKDISFSSRDRPSLSFSLFTFVSCEFWTHIPAIQCDEGPTVAHGVAVVGGAEHCDTLAVMEHLVTFLLQCTTLKLFSIM